MRINIVLNSYPRESETFLTSWIVNLLENGLEVSLVLMNKSSSNRQHYKFNGAKHVFSNSPKILIRTAINILKGNSKKTAYYTTLFGHGKPDLIHFAYTSIPVLSLEALVCLRKSGVKLIVSCRGHSENVRPYLNTERYHKLKELFSLVDKVHCVAYEMESRMITDFGLDKAKSFVNEPAIDLNRFKFKAKTTLTNTLVLITNGRLVSLKGYIFSLLAVKQLISDGVKLEYRIIGSGAEEDNILFYINRLNLTNHVRLLGAIEPSEVAKEVSNADIYIACTLNEGLSNAVIEAMAVGTPVITTNVNGMPELVDDGINGIVVNAFSDIDIYKGVKRLINDSYLYRRFSIEGRKKVEEKFDIRRQNKIFIEEYVHLLRRV